MPDSRRSSIRPAPPISLRAVLVALITVIVLVASLSFLLGKPSRPTPRTIDASGNPLTPRDYGSFAPAVRR